MRKNIPFLIAIIFAATSLYAQEKAEDIFSSAADRADVLIEIARVDKPPFKFSDSEKEEFKQIVELIRNDKPVKALEKWEEFRAGFKERSSEPGTAGNMANFLLRKSLLETDKELLQSVEEIAKLDLEKEDEKAKFDSLRSKLIESMSMDNPQYELVSRIMRFHNKIWKF